MTVAVSNINLANLKLEELDEASVIPNLNKIDKRELRYELINCGKANAVVDTYISIADDKLSREQIRRNNRKPRKITHRTVEDREFLGIYS